MALLDEAAVAVGEVVVCDLRHGGNSCSSRSWYPYLTTKIPTLPNQWSAEIRIGVVLRYCEETAAARVWALGGAVALALHRGTA
jgi:hypothetical protein